MTNPMLVLTVAAAMVVAGILVIHEVVYSDVTASGSSHALAADESVELEGKSVQLAEIPVGSWCPTGEIDLADAEPVTIGSLTVERKGDEVSLSGKFKASKSKRKRGGYRASTLAEDAVEATETLKSKDLKKGQDVEFFNDDGEGLGMVRVEENWRGIIWGVLTGWEFKLDDDTLTVIDANLDGRCSEGDRIAYGERSIWMPWHTIFSAGDTIYYELKITGDTTLSAKTREMEVPKSEQKVWDAWQEVRKDHGVRPGICITEYCADCVKHADYLKTNKTVGHDEDPSKPGYTAEGREAGLTSNVDPGRRDGMESFEYNMDTAYHRYTLISFYQPELQLGGNDYAYLMGGRSHPDYPTEMIYPEHVHAHPAPYSIVERGALRDEVPHPPVFNLSEEPGLAVIVGLTWQPASTSNVDARLYKVSGKIRTGKRGKELETHVSYPGKNTPPGHTNNSGLIVLAPLEPLKGVYEADFKFQDNSMQYSGERANKDYHLRWRFEVE